VVGTLSLCLVVAIGLTGCGDEEQVVTIEVEQLCELSLEAMNSEGCRETAYANIEDFTVCFRDCGGDTSCMDEECEDAGEGLGECSGDLQFLVSGRCDECYIDCYLVFLGGESACLYDPGDPGEIGNDCLDDLYDCVNDDC
jgi:hypothetical protein